MTGITKVFIAGFGGVFLAQYAGPKITAALPDSLKTETMGKVVAGVIGGGATALTYYVLGAVAK